MPLHVSATFVAILEEVHCKGNIKKPLETMHKYKTLSCKMYGLKYEYIVWINATPKIRKVTGGTITKFHCQATILFVGPASLQYHGPTKWV
jgi:hypothetical protein